jgi:hypothetical protein
MPLLKQLVNDMLLILLRLGFSIITIEFSDEKEKYLGWAESATGMGLAIGPTVGGLMYQ